MQTVRNLTRRVSPAVLVLLVLGFLAALASACTPHHPQSTFGASGPVAAEQADIYVFIFWIAVGVFIVVEAAIILFALAYRRRSAEIPTQTHGNTKLEITWTIIPALILVAVAVPTIRGIYSTHSPSEEAGHPLMIEAIGHQWWFEFRYPGEEIVTANELHVPAGRPVIVNLSSQDVIHSFWVPKLAGKVDMIPTRVNQIWFSADQPGDYSAQCAEYCGIAHAKMRFRVFVQEPGDYDAWVASMRTPSARPEAGSSAAEGAGLFAANCSMCHTVDTYRPGGYQAEIEQQNARFTAWHDAPDPASQDKSRIISAPNLTQFGMRTTLGAGLKELNRENLIAWITNPASIKQGTHMQEHAFIYETADRHANLSADQIGKVADYLLSLEPGETAGPEPVSGDPVARGQDLAASLGCTACHSTGSNTVVGPGWANIYEAATSRKPGLSADEYIHESIKNPGAFVVTGFPPVMPPFASLTDEQISDIIEYLKTLR